MIHYRLDYAEIIKKLPKTTQEEYDAKYAQLKRDHGNAADPNVVFNDSNKTIEISYFGEDLLIRNQKLAVALKQAFNFGEGSTAQQLNATFMTPEAEQRRESFLEDKRSELRDLDYQDVPATTPAIDTKKSATQNLIDIAGSNPKGVSFGGGHGDEGRNQVMDELLQAPGHGGMSLFFIEELHVVDQPFIDQFINSSIGSPMPKELASRAKSIAGIEKMLTSIRDHNAQNPGDKLKVFGINSSEAKMRDGKLGPETRVAMMNAVAKEVIDNALATYPNEKFMSFVGAAHSNTHAGGVPGMSQLFGIPAVKMEGDQLQMDAEDKSLRGMPSAAEMKMVEASIAKMAADPKNKGLDQHDWLKKGQELIQAAREESFKNMHPTTKNARLAQLHKQGIPLSDREIAEEVVLKAEAKTLDANKKFASPDQPEVARKKHDKLVAGLMEKLGKLPPDKKADSATLAETLANAVANSKDAGVYMKPKEAKHVTAKHVSIDVKNARKTWVVALAKL